MDFAGGTGLIYFVIRPYLANKENVIWDIVDEKIQAEIGKKFKMEDDQLNFLNDIPEKKENSYDIVFINTSLHYIEDSLGVLKKLTSLKAKYFILTRLFSGNIETFVSLQKNAWKNTNTPIKIINFKEITDCMSSHGYNLLFKIPGEKIDTSHFQKIPKSKTIPNKVHLIFALKYHTWE